MRAGAGLLRALGKRRVNAYEMGTERWELSSMAFVTMTALPMMTGLVAGTMPFAGKTTTKTA